MMKVSHEEAVVFTSQSGMDRLKNVLMQRRGTTVVVQTKVDPIVKTTIWRK